MARLPFESSRRKRHEILSRRSCRPRCEVPSLAAFRESSLLCCLALKSKQKTVNRGHLEGDLLLVSDRRCRIKRSVILASRVAIDNCRSVLL
jgi:hypothetical protein